jgi:hypothetical protein
MTDTAIALANDATDLIAGTATLSGAPTDAQPLVDGLDDGHVEAELQEMDAAADTLRKEGLISPADAERKKAEVARTRKLFRELSPTDRVAIVKRRRELGVQILNRQLAGAAVVQQNVKLNHTRLRPLFEQWWPYMNRMSLNLQRFGESTFGRKESAKVEEFLERELGSLEKYVDEQLTVALAYRAQREGEMRDNGDTIFEPTVTLPSLDLDVEAYSRYAMRVLSVLVKFDKTMDHFDFMVWNGIRDQSDVNEEVTRFLRKFHPLGLRSYMTHLKLMTTVRGG